MGHAFPRMSSNSRKPKTLRLPPGASFGESWVEWNGLEWSGREWNGVEGNGMEWSGMEGNEMEWNGVEGNGVEWHGFPKA